MTISRCCDLLRQGSQLVRDGVDASPTLLFDCPAHFGQFHIESIESNVLNSLSACSRACARSPTLEAETASSWSTTEALTAGLQTSGDTMQPTAALVKPAARMGSLRFSTALKCATPIVASSKVDFLLASRF